MCAGDGGAYADFRRVFFLPPVVMWCVALRWRAIGSGWANVRSHFGHWSRLMRPRLPIARPEPIAPVTGTTRYPEPESARLSFSTSRRSFRANCWAFAVRLCFSRSSPSKDLNRVSSMAGDSWCGIVQALSMYSRSPEPGNGFLPGVRRQESRQVAGAPGRPALLELPGNWERSRRGQAVLALVALRHGVGIVRAREDVVGAGCDGERDPYRDSAGRSSGGRKRRNEAPPEQQAVGTAESRVRREIVPDRRWPGGTEALIDDRVGDDDSAAWPHGRGWRAHGSDREIGHRLKASAAGHVVRHGHDAIRAIGIAAPAGEDALGCGNCAERDAGA